MDGTATRRVFGLWTTVRHWLLEILSLLASVGLLCTLVAVLNVFDNQPLSTVLLPASLSLNSVVAIIGVVAKGCFSVPLLECVSQWKWNWFHRSRPVDHFDAFDQASRGLWGSAALVWRFHFRHAATLGAAVYVISVMVSLFTQETIAYVPGVVRLDDSPAPSVRQVYHWGLDDLHKKFGDLAVDAALLTSLFDERGARTAIDVLATCSSANCTFPTFTTLSVCSDIVEITSSIISRNVTNAEVPWDLASDSETRYLGGAPGSAGDEAAQFIRNFSSGVEVILPNDFAIRIPNMNIAHLSPMNGTVAFKDDIRYRVGLIDMAAIFYNGDTKIPNGPNPTPIRAFEVLFYMCVNTYDVNVTNSIISSTAVSSHHTPTVSGAEAPLGCGALCNGTGSGTGTISNIAFHAGDSEYSVDVSSAQYIGASIARYLSGWRASTNKGEDIIHGYSAYKLMDDFDSYPAFGPEPSLSLVARRAAAGLNQVIQSTEWGNSIVVWGQAWESTVFIRVQWGWLGLLAGEIGLAIAFFCYTVYATHRIGIKPLKSSSMATLLALDAQARTAVEDAVSAEKGESGWARMDLDETKVRLQLKDRHLVLDSDDKTDKEAGLLTP
ncbi:hypothetical protein QBC34DRAFT_58951 [Podospora aff. communis PSN243]|uniref:Uncharacterized protein n=1 Tax=Podospora aff. communis PSN243 TaxID=3040156 RepID=A0AAV9GU73_9PEZI|nr:hypothetical protein QBC34DRAFT_58951 [Podospora aff. communis PSN243]